VTRRTRVALYIGAGFVAAALIAAIAGILVFRSGWFHDKVRKRIVAEMEHSSGGRAEIGAFDFDWRTRTARVRNIVLHGKEASGEAPLFRAAEIRIGLNIVSALKRSVDIASLIIERPVVHVVIYPDASTNVPGPAHGAGLIQRVMDMRIGHFELRNGTGQVNDRQFPFDMRGDRLAAVFDFERVRRRYAGRVSSRQLWISSPAIAPAAAMEVDADLAIEADRVQVARARFATEQSWAELAGTVRDLAAPQGEFDARASLSIAEAGRYVVLPVDRQGQAMFRGKVMFSLGGMPLPDGEGSVHRSYQIDGRVDARDVAWRSRDVRVAGIAITARVRVTPDQLDAPEFTARALGGVLQGRARLESWERFRIDAAARDLSLQQLNRLQNVKQLPWSGIASGPVELAGVLNHGQAEVLSARAKLQIAPDAGPNPVKGSIDLAYDGRGRTIDVASSALETRATRAEVSGVIGQTMHVSLETSNLDDLAPALQVLDGGSPKQAPARLITGAARIHGDISGPLDDPRFSGRIELPSFTAEGQRFDRLTALVDATRTHVTARSLELERGAMRITGSGSAGLRDWRPADASPISASLSVTDADLAQLLAQSGYKFPVAGKASATITLRGTYGSPQGEIKARVERPSAWGEQFDELQATANLTGNTVEISQADLRAGQTHVQASAVYRRSGARWDHGNVQFRIASKGVSLDQITNVRMPDYRVGGRVTVDASGSAEIKKDQLEITALSGEAFARDLSLNGAPLGAGKITASMKGGALDLQATGDLRGAQIRGAGEWQLSGDYPGRAEIVFSPVALSALRDIAWPDQVKQGLPFSGSVDGAVTISGPFRKPDAVSAAVTLNHLEMSAAPGQRVRAGARTQDVVVRNVEPIRFQVTRTALTIQSARLAAKDTKIEVAGRIAFDQKSPWDVTVRGGVNMAVFQLFNSDVLAQGNAVLDAAIRGPLRDPQVQGHLDLRNASLNLADLPAGVDNANGTVLFDRNRATIERLTAEIGGGRVAFGGFVGFGGGVLLYRVQANADHVRLRSSNGATGTFNAALNLTGSSQNALVSGSVTVLKAGFAPQTDLGGLLAESAQPVTAPAAPDEYLRTINFDVRIESGPSLEFETALTHNIEAEAELRLRGTAARPVLLGDISLSGGNIMIFGSKYEINRGDIRFLNPTRIEPTVDIDLETKARGITVGLNFTGTLNKLNVTYRSDPPLQTSDIIALLAVGRDPMASAGLANTQVTYQSNVLSPSPNTITQAISAPTSSRLQRFFGVSRIKIDPQMLGVENTPQARLTMEQQVSRDVTVTYVTTLSLTQEQIFRVRWDLNKQWSALATREENGVFGIDFVYKKRFK
jgi:translocation and assembly module TamB